MRRVFIAINISEEARRLAGLYIDNLRQEFPKLRVRWEQLSKLHLTARFIGNVDDKQLESVLTITERVAGSACRFLLTVEGTGVFPSVEKASVLWLGVRDEKGSVFKLKESIEAELEKICFPNERRVLKPHLTIARIKDHRILGAELAKKHLESNIESVEFEVSQITVYESKLLPTGSVYSIISTHRLE